MSGSDYRKDNGLLIEKYFRTARGTISPKSSSPNDLQPHIVRHKTMNKLTNCAMDRTNADENISISNKSVVIYTDEASRDGYEHT